MRAALIMMPLGICLLLISCDSLDPLERDNIVDPHGDDFRPHVPIRLEASYSDNVVTLEWVNTSDFADGILIERAIDDTTTFEEIARLDPDATTFRDSLDIPVFMPSYRVSSFRDDDGTPRTQDYNQVSVDLYDIQAQSIDIDQVHEIELSISWPNPFPYDVTFVLENAYSKHAEFYTVMEVDATEVTFELENPYWQYFFRVAARYGDQQSPYFQVAQFVQGERSGVNLQAEHVDEHAVRIRWNEPWYAAGYVLERRGEGDPSFKRLREFERGDTSFVDDTVHPSERYEYRARTLASRMNAITVSHRFGMDQIWRVDTTDEEIRALALSGNGQTLASGGDDAHLRLRSVDDGSLQHMLDVTREIRRVAIDDDGHTVATAGFSHSASPPSSTDLWDVLNGQHLWRIDELNVGDLALIAGGTQVLHGGDVSNKELYVQDVATMDTVRVIATEEEIRGFAVSADESEVAITSEDYTYLYDLISGDLIRTYGQGGNRVRLDKNADILAIIDAAGQQVHTFAASTGAHHASFSSNAVDVAISTTGDYAAVATDRHIDLYDPLSGEHMFREANQLGLLQSVVSIPGQEGIVSAAQAVWRRVPGDIRKWLIGWRWRQE